MFMSGYTKLFNSILASSIWGEDDKTRLVWITLLAMADKFGVADGSVPGIATLARVKVEDVQKALTKLQSPDKDSRSEEYEGRRIQKIDGGWLILNHDKYRAKIDDDERREYLRVKKAESRKRLAGTVNIGQQPSKKSTQAEAEAETDTKAQTEAKKQKTVPADETTNARSKRPIFKSTRFVVFEWQLDDLRRLLGPSFDAFDVHAWFFDLGSKADAAGLVIPQRDGGKWLQEQTLAEAVRRGLPVATAAAGVGKTSGNAAAAARFVARGQR